MTDSAGIMTGENGVIDGSEGGGNGTSSNSCTVSMANIFDNMREITIEMGDIFDLLQDKIISVQCDECGGNLSYFTEEEFTGQRWVDGKKIYQKTLILPGPLYQGTAQNTPHNIENINMFVDVDAIFHNLPYTSRFSAPLPWMGLNGVDASTVWMIEADNEKVTLMTDNPNLSAEVYIVYMTLQYTCTDR